MAINSDRPLGWVVQSAEERCDRRFSTAGEANDSGISACREGQVNVAQHWLGRSAGVGKGHAVEMDVDGLDVTRQDLAPLRGGIDQRRGFDVA